MWFQSTSEMTFGIITKPKITNSTQINPNISSSFFTQLHKTKRTITGLLIAHCIAFGSHIHRRLLQQTPSNHCPRIQIVCIKCSHRRVYPTTIVLWLASNSTNFYIFFPSSSSSSFSGLVWGSSVKHQPQKVGIEHVLNDEDVVQIVKKVWIWNMYCFAQIDKYQIEKYTKFVWIQMHMFWRHKLIWYLAGKKRFQTDWI